MVIGMVIGMATQKVTVTLPVEQLDEIRRLVELGTARSVSGFVQHAIVNSLTESAAFTDMLNDILRQTGGPMTSDEKVWADDVIGVKKSRRRKSVA
jgi:Arc/MetJ-type ribon-helix-helix transcriptional regulator